MTRLAHPGQDRQNLRILLAGIGLTGNRKALGEADSFSHHAVQLSNLAVVAFEQGQVAGLGAGGSFDAPRSHHLELSTLGLQVEKGVLQPEAGPLAHGCQLSRLEVGEGECGDSASPAGEVSQFPSHRGCSLADQLESLTHQDHVGVVGDECGGSAQMEDTASISGLFSEMAQMGDHVVSCLTLDLGYPIEIHVVRHRFQLRDLFFGDGQAHQLSLAVGQDDPHSTPQTIAVPGGEKRHHFTRGVAIVEGVLGGCGDHGA